MKRLLMNGWLALFCATLCAGFGAASASAADLTREQALRQLSSKSADLRGAAVRRLGEVGRYADANLLAKRLFDEDEDTREAAEAALWAVWSRSGDARVDALFKKGVSQMNSAGIEEATATFTEVIRIKPDFAEGWNKRATVLFFQKRYTESLADCEEVIKRNPNHFGALSGYGQIYAQLKEWDKALEYFEKALAVNPNMEAVAVNIEGIKRIIAQQRRRAT
jgi:tetratricopeptide (TPR) repeat protein